MPGDVSPADLRSPTRSSGRLLMLCAPGIDLGMTLPNIATDEPIPVSIQGLIAILVVASRSSQA